MLHAGLPKAALVSHGKALAYPKIVLAIDLKPEDVMYDVLPFYHATGLFGWLAASEIGKNCKKITKVFKYQYFRYLAQLNA